MKDPTEILNKTISLFANNGYAGTSINDICKACSVSRPTLYYYFGNKEGLYRAVLQKACGDIANSAIWDYDGQGDDALLTVIGNAGRALLSDDEIAACMQLVMMEFLRPTLRRGELESRELADLRSRASRLGASVSGLLTEDDRKYLLDVVTAQLIQLRSKYLCARVEGFEGDSLEQDLEQMRWYTMLVVKTLELMHEGLPARTSPLSAMQTPTNRPNHPLSKTRNQEPHAAIPNNERLRS